MKSPLEKPFTTRTVELEEKSTVFIRRPSVFSQDPFVRAILEPGHVLTEIELLEGLTEALKRKERLEGDIEELRTLIAQLEEA